MNRPISLFLAAGGLVVFPLVDSAIKGTIVLLLAGSACLVLRRDSAATRHFVWSMAICLLIAMPMLSLVLPEWRVLPSWVSTDEPVDAATSPTFLVPWESSMATSGIAESSRALPLPNSFVSEDGEPVEAISTNPGRESARSIGLNPAETMASSPVLIPWTTWLSGIWFAGCVALVLRLLAAGALLRSAARRSLNVIAVSPPDSPPYRVADTGCSPIVGYRTTTRRADAQPLAMANAESQRLLNALIQATALLGVKKPIQLLLDPHRSIPIVWGLLKTRLQLPAEAVQWTEEQLQSVLLHELAHVRRRDLLVLALTQVACALYWFNPLVWLAAWRLHVERERACDDLVLASGVRASAYAEHLLNVATRLTSSPWTQACGLAMARNSSLHGRLTAVLSEKQNRRMMTNSIASLSLCLGFATAIPIGMLQGAVNQEDKSNPPLAEPPLKQDGIGERQQNLEIEIEFAKLVLPKAIVDLEQRRAANKDVRAFTEAEIAESEHAVEKAETDLQALLEKAKTQTIEVNELPPGIEQHLDWSEPVNGLRAALSIRKTSGKGVQGNERKILIVLQNVSDQPIRFCDTAIHETDTPAADVEGRKLYVETSGEIMAGIQNAKSTKTDLVLQPRHMLSLDMFDNEQSHKMRDSLAEGIVKDSTWALIAVLNIAHAPEGAWTGKLKTPPSRGAFAAEAALPLSKEGQALFRYCIDHARLDGKIPGGLISGLHDLVKEFIELNSGDEYGDAYAKKMQPLLAKFERKGDWKQFDVVVLFEDIAAVSTIPLERTMDVIRENTLQRGQPIPASMNDVNWGETLPGGLRMAWVLEPRADQYHRSSELKSHVILQNSGDKPVMFVTRSFHQPDHKAVTASGTTVQVESTFWTTIGRPEPWRLHPGEFCEVYAPGLGIGPKDKELEDWSNVRAGSWIFANEDDDIIFQPGEIMLTGDHNEKVDPDWWLKFITARIRRDTPLPDDAKEREVILFRVISDLFGYSPTPEEAAAFLADTSPQAVDHLAKMLSERTWHSSVAGPIKSGEIKFHVLPEDPDAATRPRVATNPAHYNLSDEMRFVVTRRSIGEQIINEADIVWYPPGKESAPTKVPLPNGYDTWAAGWLPETTILWLSQAGFLRSYDFADHAAVKETRYEGDQIEAAPIPADVREALSIAIAKAGVANPKPQRPPAPPAVIKDDSASVKEPSESPVSNTIRGRLLLPDNTPAVGYWVHADDGFDRFKARMKDPDLMFSDLPKPSKTNENGAFEISLTENQSPESHYLWVGINNVQVSSDFAPLEVPVPENGRIGDIKLSTGRRIIGRVIGLDGNGLANVSVWSTRQNARGGTLALMRNWRSTKTDADGSFTLPPFAAGTHLLKIATRDLGEDELRVAFASQIVEVEDTTPWAPVNFKELLTANSGNERNSSPLQKVLLSNVDSSAINVEIRPLETVDITLDVVVDRKNPAFSDFELRISGFLPGVDTEDPCAWWIRDESTKLTTGKYTIAVPKGLTNVTLTAQKVYMRKDDEPGFIWKRPSGEELDATGRLKFEKMSEPMTLMLRVQDAAPLKIDAVRSKFSLLPLSREAIQQETERLRTADRGGEYDLGNGRTLRIDTRNETKQSFTVRWKETSESSGYRLNVVPKQEEATSADIARMRMVPIPARVGRQTIGWSVVWEQGSPILWLAESGLISKLDITDPEQVVWTQYDRSGSLSSSEIPDEIRRRLHSFDVYESILRGSIWPGNIGRDNKPATVQTLTATRVTR